MRLVHSARFEKHYRKLSSVLRSKAEDRLTLFTKDPFHPLLNNHALHGRDKNKRSINVGGDYRIVYSEVQPQIYLLIDIGTHSELYS